MKAKVYIPMCGVPQGSILVNDEAIEHPTNGREGALIKFTKTGIYKLFYYTAMCGIPQDYAKQYDMTLKGETK